MAGKWGKATDGKHGLNHRIRKHRRGQGLHSRPNQTEHEGIEQWEEICIQLIYPGDRAAALSLMAGVALTETVIRVQSEIPVQAAKVFMLQNFADDVRT